MNINLLKLCRKAYFLCIMRILSHNYKMFSTILLVF